MINNFYIASRLAKIRCTLKEDEEIHASLLSLQKDLKGQQDFYSYCKEYKLAPWTYIQLLNKDLLDLFNVEVKSLFANIHAATKLENENRQEEAKKFLLEFQKQGIEVVILKGNLFLDTIYNNAGYKKMNDFDMLIHSKDWGKVQQIYYDQGYIPLGFGWGGEKGEVAKFSHAGLSFLSPNNQCITGTQWGLKSPTSKYTLNSNDIWETSLAYDFLGINTRKLSAEYNLLHLVLHMGIYKCGIRDCMDVFNLLLAEPNFNTDDFIKICKEANATDKAYFTLKLANLCSHSIPQYLIDKLQPRRNSFIIRRLESRIQMSEKTGDIQESYNDYFHGVEMTVFYFSLFHYFHQKVYFYAQLIRELFWPKSAMARKLSDYTTTISLWQKIKARIKAPYLVFSLLGEEIGIGITILLFIKMFFDCFISLKNYLFRKENYFDYLKSRNIEPNEIQRVVKGIQ